MKSINFNIQGVFFFVLSGLFFNTKNNLIKNTSVSNEKNTDEIYIEQAQFEFEGANPRAYLVIKTLSNVRVKEVHSSSSLGQTAIMDSYVKSDEDYNSTTKQYTGTFSMNYYFQSATDNNLSFTFTATDENGHKFSYKKNYTFSQIMRDKLAQYIEPVHVVAVRVGDKEPERRPDLPKVDFPIFRGEWGGRWHDLRQSMILLSIRIKTYSSELKIPDDANTNFIMGLTQLGDTANLRKKEDYWLPLSHLNQANALAPWWDKVYKQLGRAYEFAHEYYLAKKNFELYLLFQPPVAEADVIRKEIIKLDAILESQRVNH